MGRAEAHPRPCRPTPCPEPDVRGSKRRFDFQTAQRNGTISAMKSAIDSAGRIVIPREVRRQAGLKPGMPLDVRFKDGRVEIEPAPLTVPLVPPGRLMTHPPLAFPPPLPAVD